ncbi:MAG: glycoside hydrolase family 5 protein [Firmicutes bacterium]|nr:glycoside hydrolase family 5 protein [[Eubacterium] siraeum]MCM1487516.1 glycoside hydrolase family 5 protein [Bacillota bacterium]
MKRKILKGISAALSLLVLISGCNSNGVKGTGTEIVKYEVAPYDLPENEGMEFVKNLKIGWNLGNTLEATTVTAKTTKSETSWGNPVTSQEMIDMVQKAGFNTVRVPVSWSNHLEEGTFTVKQAWMDRVKEVVDYAYNRGMFVILNIHHDISPDYYYPDYEHLENSKKYSNAIWEQLCEVYKDYDEHLIFESINEPRLKNTEFEWWLDINSDIAKESIDCIMQINQEFVDLVRASGGNNGTRWLMTPGYDASYLYVVCDQFELPEDPQNRTMVSIHAYEPYDFALSDQMNASSFDKDINGGSLIIIFDQIYEKFTSKGIPVVMGEFGCRNKDNLESRIVHAGYYVAVARAAGISCLWWDNGAFEGDGELFGLLDRDTLEWRYPDIVLSMMENYE